MTANRVSIGIAGIFFCKARVRLEAGLLRDRRFQEAGEDFLQQRPEARWQEISGRLPERSRREFQLLAGMLFVEGHPEISVAITTEATLHLKCGLDHMGDAHDTATWLGVVHGIMFRMLRTFILQQGSLGWLPACALVNYVVAHLKARLDTAKRARNFEGPFRHDWPPNCDCFIWSMVSVTQGF